MSWSSIISEGFKGCGKGRRKFDLAFPRVKVRVNLFISLRRCEGSMDAAKIQNIANKVEIAGILSPKRPLHFTQHSSRGLTTAKGT